MPQVRKGDRVTINYTGKFKNGTVFETTTGGSPLQFTVGKNKVIKGFEAAVVGMSPGESKTVTIKPAQGYGPRDPGLVLAVKADELPGGLNPAVGEIIFITQGDGTKLEMNVTRVEEGMVTLDGNHPLAGRDLIFEIKLVAIG